MLRALKYDVKGLELGEFGLRFKIKGLGFRVWVQGSGSRVESLRFGI